jgi:hypothetical protein
VFWLGFECAFYNPNNPSTVACLSDTLCNQVCSSNTQGSSASMMQTVGQEFSSRQEFQQHLDVSLQHVSLLSGVDSNSATCGKVKIQNNIIRRIQIS